jgi:serpin B
MKVFVLAITMFLLPVSQAAETKPAVDANNAFAIDLYKQIALGSDKNIFFSPSSISTALAMTSLGARAETEKQMQTVLKFDLASPQTMHQAYAELLKINNTEGPDHVKQLTIANRLWGQKDYHFLPAFLDETKKYYGAPLEELNFHDTESARTAINDWVKKQTADRIKDLLKPGALDANTRLVLTNAVYFKAAWANPFKKEKTHQIRFHPAAALDIDIPMMNRQGAFRYAEDELAQILELPFAGDQLSMVIFLPRDHEGPFTLEKAMTAKWLGETLANLKEREVQVGLPPFRMGGSFEFSSVLSNMGMPLAFDIAKADFSSISKDEGLFISKVIHQAWGQVNEEGAEAAGATAIAVDPKAEPINPPTSFYVNHSFVYLIRDTRTGIIVFMGRILNPA